jgi:TRAP-type C4-dicarboxylate transport system substrate-binding protein
MSRKLFFSVTLSLLLACSGAVNAKSYKLATISPDGLGWMKKFRDGTKEIAAATDGRVKFKIYPGGVQGDDYTVLRKMRIGQLHGGAVTASSLTRFYPDLQVYNLPLQFRGSDEIDFVRENMDQQIIDGLAESGMVSFNLTETGFAYILSKNPINNLDDLKNAKTWVPDGDPISAKLVQSFGISPIPLPIIDVLAGLQTGLIDTVIVPPIVAIALQWHNQVSYMTDLPVLYIYSMLAMSEKSFNSMSDADQKVVTDVFNRVFDEVDADNRIDNKKAYDALVKQGLQVITPAVKDLTSWRQLAETSIENLVSEGEISQQSVDRLRANLAEVRGDDAHSAP